ncbi:COBRA-like protein 7 [Apium graveolens]|uniref:COBRA-like protein 7 n=1 Tax=Apium graveolens TaxID=4045 RepID=UPI003D799057
MAPPSLLISLLFISLHLSPISPQPTAPPPSSSTCNSIYISYTISSVQKIPPTLKSNQPYRFESSLFVLNNGLDELKSWRVFVGFKNDEVLVSASNAVLSDGTSLPGKVGNGSVFVGYPNADLKTGVETAGDLSQMSVKVDLVGTEFGVGVGSFPLPGNVSLVNDGFVCPPATIRGKNQMELCCTKDPKFKSNVTVDEEFLPRQDGDLTIMYDVTKTYESNYWADVTISNHNPLGRLDNWKLKWDWMRDEFIFAMKGAYPSIIDSSKCIFGKQGEYYKDMDFSTVLNCERGPTIVDLPLTKTNDTAIGLVPFCCRNGTILPPTMDPSKSISAFKMQVFKMPPDLNRSQLSPPQNWKISGRLNPDYECGPPVRVSPSRFSDPGGLSDTTAVASWQVVCNITQAKGSSPRCCVSFSAYYNESIIPCKTCACGCPSNTARTCSTSAPALLLPSQALLVPFENRTKLSLAWAGLKHLPVSNPLPCGDNCGVSINWHLLTDYRGGWSARMTVFNWEDEAFVDWFAAIEMDKAARGFKEVYSFNGSALNGVDNTIFMEGLPGLNYLVGETDAAKPDRDPRVPGKQQSVISFTKKQTPGIDIPAGDGFPTKVFFNGEECSLPRILPSGDSYRLHSSVSMSFLLAILILILIQQ